MASDKQREALERRLEACCASNASQQTYKGWVFNPRSAIRLAFTLGVRFALAHPELAGDYMGAFIRQHASADIGVDDLGKLHQRAMHNIVLPMYYTPEDFEHTTTEELQDDERS